MWFSGGNHCGLPLHPIQHVLRNGGDAEALFAFTFEMGGHVAPIVNVSLDFTIVIGRALPPAPEQLLAHETLSKYVELAGLAVSTIVGHSRSNINQLVVVLTATLFGHRDSHCLENACY